MILILLVIQTTLLHGQVWERFLEDAKGTIDIIGYGDKLGVIGSENFYISENGMEWSSFDFSEQLGENFDSGVTGGFFDENNGIIVTGNFDYVPRMLVTNDGGKSWEAYVPEYLMDCSPSFRVFDLHILNASCALLQGVTSGTIYKTCDRGLTWTCSTDFYPEAGVWLLTNIVSDSVWYMAGAQYHHKTVDGGQSYARLIKKTFSFVQRNDDGKLYGLTYYYNEADQIPMLFSSSDDWITRDSIALSDFKGVFIHSFVVLDDNQLMILTGSEDIYYSSDGGITFNLTQNLGFSPFRATRINDEWFLTGRGAFRLNQEISNVEIEPAVGQVSVYPNPTRGQLYLQEPFFGKYRIMNIDGSIVLSGRIASKSIDLGSVEAGFYYIELFSEDNRFVKSFIKL